MALAPPITAGKTIGDLVNGEIERTLEISHQSIINAAVNMSTAGSGSGSSSGAHFMERAFLADRSNERLLINLHAQRPERVHVRPLGEEGPEPQPTNYSQATSSTGNNLATLAHVAYNQKSQSGGAGARASSSARSARDYQPVALPRAEMKGCIEAYFHEEQQS